MIRGTNSISAEHYASSSSASSLGASPGNHPVSPAFVSGTKTRQEQQQAQQQRRVDYRAPSCHQGLSQGWKNLQRTLVVHHKNTTATRSNTNTPSPTHATSTTLTDANIEDTASLATQATTRPSLWFPPSLQSPVGLSSGSCSAEELSLRASPLNAATITKQQKRILCPHNNRFNDFTYDDDEENDEDSLTDEAPIAMSPTEVPTFPIPQGPQAPPFATHENYWIYNYLREMPNCVKSMQYTRGDPSPSVMGNNLPMKNTIPFAMHHIDGKTIGGLCVLREWGAENMYALFIGYNPVVIPGYFEDFSRATPTCKPMPIDALQATILDMQGGDTFGDDSTYQIAPEQRFVTPLPQAALNGAFKRGGGITVNGTPMTFLEANRCMGGFLLLRAFADAITTKKRVVIFEDGGYLNPLVDAAIDKPYSMSVAEFRQVNGIPLEEATDAKLPMMMSDVVKEAFLGSCELTRNGYDATRCLWEERAAKFGTGHLNTRFFSIAASYLKICIEGDNITLAVLNGLDQVLYGLGWSLSHRNICVMGSRGNLGRRFTKHVNNAVRDYKTQLVGFDMKVGWPAPGPKDTPDWQVPWSTPNTDIGGEYLDFKSIPLEVRRNLDCIVGFTGGPTTDVKNPKKRYGTYGGDDFADWLVHGTKPVMFLASGSTKTSEFEDVLAFLAYTLKMPEATRNVNGVPCQVEVAAIPDSLTLAAVEAAGLDTKKITRNFGTQYAFRLDYSSVSLGSVDAVPKTVVKVLYLVNDTMPVNFMFYGTPTEIIDYTFSQVTSATAKMCELYEEGNTVLPSGKKSPSNPHLHHHGGSGHSANPYAAFLPPDDDSMVAEPTPKHTPLLPGCYPTGYSLLGTEGVYMGQHLTADYNSPPSSGVPAPGVYDGPLPKAVLGSEERSGTGTLWM